MRQQRGLVALQPFEQRQHRLRGIEPGPHRRGGDQQTEHALDAGNHRLPAGTHNAVDHVALVGEAGQQHGPGALQHGGEREAVPAGEGFEPGGELG